jgi:hypothetical protein
LKRCGNELYSREVSMRSSKIVEVRAQLAEHYGKFATIADWLADVKVSKSLFVRNEIKMSLLLEYSKDSATPLTRSSFRNSPDS